MHRYDPFYVLGPMLALGFFAMDLSLELGIAGGVLYNILILMCLPRGADRHLPWALITALGLTLLGWQLSPAGSETWKVVMNRVLTMGMHVAAALAIGLKHRADRRLAALQAEQRQAERDAAEREELARLGEMASLVAHEVKNAMGGIRGAVQVIGRDFPEGGPKAEGARRIYARIDSLVAWVQQVLTYSRPFELDPKALEVQVLVNSTVLQFQDDRGHDVRVVVDLPDDPLPIHGDPALLRRALLNLLLNAAQASPGRAIHVTVRADGNDWCEIQVQDEGPGIPAELRDKVLEPFFTTRSSGTGLGLPLVRKTAQRHGGELALRFPGTGGTVATMRLPRHQLH